MRLDRREFLGSLAGATFFALQNGRISAAAETPVPKLKPSMNCGFDNKIPFAEAVARIKDVGFDIISIDGAKYCQYDTPEGVSAIEKLLHRYNLTIDWIHAPSPQGDRLFSLDESTRLDGIQQCRKALDAAQALGIPAMTLHLLLPYDIPHDEKRDQMLLNGIESVKSLEEYAAARKVKIGLENGQRKDYDEVLTKFLGHFTSETIGLTYDTGHENVKSPGFEILANNPSRLYILHLHDNPGDADRHQLPYEGSVDWKKFGEVLRKNPHYTGTLGLEVFCSGSRYKDDRQLFLVEAKERVDRLASLI